MFRPVIELTLCLAVILLSSAAMGAGGPERGEYFAITVVDEETGRGVPLVELTTVNHIHYYTDSAGVVAFYEPGLMGTDVFFHVKSHGYEYPKDGFGYAGLALKPVEGGSATIRIKRTNIAERLYRITGGGIYADSILLGRKPPTRQPAINGLVLGQDSVLTAIYRDKLFWVWGDTDRPAYPLGNFMTTCATSFLPGKGGLDPEKGVDLTYFTRDDGFTKEMAPIPGHGPVWLGGLVTLVDGGRDRLFAGYGKVDSNMKALEVGVMEFSDEKQLFERVATFDLDAPIRPTGRPFGFTDGGVEYIYFTPLTRVRADAAHYKDQSAYEAFTCTKPGSRREKIEIERGADGKPVYAWKHDAPPLFPQEETRAVKDGLLKPEEAWFHIQDVDTGKPVLMHGQSVSWNPFRKRWVMIMGEIFGSSFLGEIWYMEADTPLGPWVYARKVVTHDKYTFYNPWHHTEFDKKGGREIFFEGTYTDWLSGNTDPTPRYNYNQIMYKLDLADPKLALPVAVYGSTGVWEYGGMEVSDTPTLPHPQTPTLRQAVFFAPDLPGVNTVPVYQENGDLKLGGKGKPVFYGLPPDTPNPPPTTTPLYEFVRGSDGKHVYTTDAEWKKEGLRRSDRPVCLVWRKP